MARSESDGLPLRPRAVLPPPMLEDTMGLRDKLKKRARAVIDRLSGEHSDAAPENRQDYARPGVPNEEAEVVMAKLTRPKGSDD